MYSQFIIDDDAIITAGLELVFTIRRRFFYELTPIVLAYQVSAGSALPGTHYTEDADPFTGFLTFQPYDIWKKIRIATVADSVSQNETVLCTILPASQYRILAGKSVGVGVIQQGDVFYIASAASGGLITNSGEDILNPTTYDNYRALMQVQPSGNGAGRAIAFKRGDGFDVPAIPDIDGSRYGGTVANPIITCAYGGLNDPAPVLNMPSDFGLTAGVSTNDPRHIFQDLEMSALEPNGGRPVFHSGNDNTPEYPQGTEYLRCIMRNWWIGDGTTPLGFTNPQMKNCHGMQYKFNTMIRIIHYGLLLQDSDDVVCVGNRWTECGQEYWEGAIGWTASMLNCNNFTFGENFLDNNNQGMRFQGVGTPGARTLHAHHNFARWSPTATLPWEVRGGHFVIRGTLYDSIIENNASIGGTMAYIEEISGPAETLQLTYRNNLAWHNKRNAGTDFNCLNLSFNQNDGVQVYNNTNIVDGQVWAAMTYGYSPVVNTWSQNVDRRNNITMRINVPSATRYLSRDLGDAADLGNEDYNQYYDSVGKIFEKNNDATPEFYDTLAAFKLAYGTKEQNSVEANPVLVNGVMPFPIIPLAPAVGQSGLTTHDMFGTPRDGSTCAGACHVNPTAPSGVYMR